MTDRQAKVMQKLARAGLREQEQIQLRPSQYSCVTRQEIEVLRPLITKGLAEQTCRSLNDVTITATTWAAYDQWRAAR